jgi:hypothetical protein
MLNRYKLAELKKKQEDMLQLKFELNQAEINNGFIFLVTLVILDRGRSFQTHFERGSFHI